MFPLLLLFYLSFLSIYYPPFLGYININSYVKLCEAEFNGKTKFEGCKVWHSWKITTDRGGKRLKILPYGWKKSDMVGKVLRMEGDKFRYGWKKSDMVGKLLRIQGGNDWNYSHMVGKSPTWSENYSGWKATNSNMVGNFPQGVRKGVPSHRTFSLLHPSYRREFPIPFSISALSPPLLPTGT